MLNISVKTVPDDHQRYNTVGDYYLEKDGTRTFIISDMKDWRYEMLVAIHELIESALCRHRGITDEMIDSFDNEFEKNRIETDGVSEAGDSPDAPYHKEHMFATQVEKMFAEELGVDWKKYEDICEKQMLNKETI